MAEFQRSEPYADRQLRRWSGQWRRAREATGLADVPALDHVFTGLTATRPAVPAPRVVHGDYGLANVFYDPTEPTRVQAVLDWELASLGDPLADLGALVAYWSEMGRLLNAGRPDPVCHPSAQPALPSPQQLADEYAEASGSDVAGLSWYITLAIARMAVIVAGALHRLDPDDPETPQRRKRSAGLISDLAAAAEAQLAQA